MKSSEHKRVKNKQKNNQQEKGTFWPHGNIRHNTLCGAPGSQATIYINPVLPYAATRCHPFFPVFQLTGLHTVVVVVVVVVVDCSTVCCIFNNWTLPS